jgi:tetratricopeptide (TPR) repeat protein
MEDFIERLERLFAAGELAQAAALIATYEATDAVRHALGMAALAAHHKDAAGCTRHAERAHALRPHDPMALQYMAIAALLRGDRKAAEAHARTAVDRGGGVRSLGWLGNIQLGAGDVAAAEQTYRHMLELAPGHVQALNGLGACRYKQQDLDQATAFLARAFDQDPTDPAPIRSLMNMYGDAGRVLGALALAGLVRDRHLHTDDESGLALDLMVLHLNHVLMGGYPPPNTVPDADAAVAAVVRRAGQRPVRVRLGVARALIDCQRHDDARRLVAELDDARELSTVDRGNAEYVRALLAQHAGDAARALAGYEAAVAIDPRRWDACCNALTLLLERGDPDALARAAALLARVPAEVKGTSPQLLFNEAVYLRRAGRPDDARANLERVLTATQGDGELGALARQLLTEVSDG